MDIDEKDVFVAALALSDAEEREAYLQSACAGHPELLGRLRALLSAHEEAQGPLDRPPAALGATADGAHTDGAGSVIGPYKLIEQIGEGGMGTVWMAEQTTPVKRVVALKVIKAGLDSRQVLARFGAERQALALMDHPNIAKVLDAGATDQGRPFFVMELVNGTPITRYCDEQRLTPKERLELFLPVCAAVQHAHQKGIIHRDIKPSNILVGLYDGKPVPKIIDFGVAKAMGQKLTEQTLFTGFGAVIGTPEYMSPEQAQVENVDIDTRSDIYSLGVLLYELLTGTTPLQHKRVKEAAMLEVLRLVREEEPPKPSTRLSSTEELPSIAANRNLEPRKLTGLVHGDLDWIVMKALEKDRNRRYETASAFAADVQRYLADEPVQAGPPSTLYRLKKFVRRNRGPVLAAGLVLLALVAGIMGTTWQAVRAEQRAEGERLAKARAEANFALANEAVEKYLGTVTNDPDLKRSDFNRLRKKLLESALPFFQKLTEQKSDDPEVEARRGRAHDRLAVVRIAMGENEAAVGDLEAAQAILARLTTDFPAVPAYRYELAKSLTHLGQVLDHVGKRREAEAAFRQALSNWEKLDADFPNPPPEYRGESAVSHNQLGNLLNGAGNREEAERSFRQALDIRAQLVGDFPTVPEYRTRLAQSHDNLGLLLSTLGRSQQAETAFGQALAIQEKLVAEFPAEPDCRWELARNYQNLGVLQSNRSKHRDAEAAYRQALDISEKLAAEFPTVPDYRKVVAQGSQNLGIALVLQGKHSDADAALRQAVDLYDKLAAGFPTVVEYRRMLATSRNSLGGVLHEWGKDAQAISEHRQALAILEKPATELPNDPRFEVDIAACYCNLGNAVQDSGQPETSLEWYQKAIARLEPVLAKEPRLVQARQFLRNSHWGRAEALDALGRYAEGRRDWERALELDGGHDEAFFRSKLADSRLRTFRKDNDAAGCLAAAAEYEALNPTDAGGLYDAACYRAVCAAVLPQDPKTPAGDAARLGKEQADLAMAWLGKAVAAGFVDTGHMKQDADLDALREREDFKKLLAELEAKQQETRDENQQSEKKE
jgi:serine/threonine protein kinase/Flp pilus assembly protein TadD